MTVVGFPTAAATAPQTLLHQHRVTSRKIAGFGQNLTFVLKLSPAATHSDTATNFALTQDCKQPPVQCYRRKSPGRDKKRAEDRKAKLCPQASELSPRLFEATPDKDVCVESDTDNSTPLLDTGYSIANDARATRADSTVLQNDDLCGGVSVASKPDKHTAREDVSEKHGNDLASLDPPNSARDCCWITGLYSVVLRDTHSNNTHRRVATNDDKEKPLIIFKTDDTVFVYNPERRASCGMTGKSSYWFAKQDSQHMLQEEKDFLRKLNTWRLIEK